jgi:hypothetical protein
MYIHDINQLSVAIRQDKSCKENTGFYKNQCLDKIRRSYTYVAAQVSLLSEKQQDYMRRILKLSIKEIEENLPKFEEIS